MPRGNHIVNNKPAGLFGRILFTLIFLLGCIEYVEAKAYDVDEKVSVSTSSEAEIGEDIILESGTIYIVEGTVVSNLENAVSSEIVYVKEKYAVKKEVVKPKNTLHNKKEKPEPTAKAADESVKKEFQFIGTNKVPSSLYEISNGIKSIMPTSVSSKAVLLKTDLTQQSISFFSDCPAEKKLQFSFYPLAGKTMFYLTAMAVRPPPHLLG
mgnify:CR=1 FL=1